MSKNENGCFFVVVTTALSKVLKSNCTTGCQGQEIIEH